jgi:hypothetical protein
MGETAMSKRFMSLIIAVAVCAGVTLPAARAASPPPGDAKPVRELLVPFDDLNVLLEGPTRRVLISRQQYEALLEQAKTTPEEPAPRKAAIIAASYEAQLGDERAQITGTLTIDVLEDGLHTVGLDLSRVGLRRATLDGNEGAPIGMADDGRLMLFVSRPSRPIRRGRNLISSFPLHRPRDSSSSLRAMWMWPAPRAVRP